MQRYEILIEFKKNLFRCVSACQRTRWCSWDYPKNALCLGRADPAPTVVVIGYPQGAPLHWANTSVRPYGGCYWASPVMVLPSPQLLMVISLAKVTLSRPTFRFKVVTLPDSSVTLPVYLNS